VGSDAFALRKIETTFVSFLDAHTFGWAWILILVMVKHNIDCIPSVSITNSTI
jgi:hypothetical protein